MKVLNCIAKSLQQIGVELGDIPHSLTLEDRLFEDLYAEISSDAMYPKYSLGSTWAKVTQLVIYVPSFGKVIINRAKEKE